MGWWRFMRLVMGVVMLKREIVGNVEGGGLYLEVSVG